MFGFYASDLFKSTLKLHFFFLDKNNQNGLFYAANYFLFNIPLYTLCFILMFQYHLGIWTFKANYLLDETLN